jgi:hypothetical protein
VAFTALFTIRGNDEAARKIGAMNLTPGKMRLLLRAIGTEIAKMARANVTAQIAAPKEYEERLPGAKSTRTLERLRASINWALSGSSGVSVATDDIIAAQRQFGGTINAKPGGALTLPVAPEAYGHRAGEFTNLFMIKQGGFAILAAIGGTAFRQNTKSGEKGLERLSAGLLDASRFTIMYLLLKSVTTRPHPFWPTIDQALDRAILIYNDFMQRQQQGGAASA